MSEHESRQLVEQAYASFKAGDIQTLLQSMSEDIAWQLPEIENVPFAGNRREVPTTDIIGTLDTVNSLYEEPFFSCRQGGGSPPPAATGSPSPIRAVSEQHLHAVLSLVRRTGRRSSVPLASRPSGNRFSRFPTNMARGVPGWLVVPREQSVTLMSPEAMHMRQPLPNSHIAAVFA
jgi:hypothetical protein